MNRHIISTLLHVFSHIHFIKASICLSLLVCVLLQGAQRDDVAPKGQGRASSATTSSALSLGPTVFGLALGVVPLVALLLGGTAAFERPTAFERPFGGAL